MTPARGRNARRKHCYGNVARCLKEWSRRSTNKLRLAEVRGMLAKQANIAMPIRPELRPLYPPHWRELSSHVRFVRASGKCQRCGRPHLVHVRCLPDGRWFDEQSRTWRDRHGRMARWPDLVEATRFRMTRVVLS